MIRKQSKVAWTVFDNIDSVSLTRVQAKEWNGYWKLDLMTLG